MTETKKILRVAESEMCCLGCTSLRDAVKETARNGGNDDGLCCTCRGLCVDRAPKMSYDCGPEVNLVLRVEGYTVGLVADDTTTLLTGGGRISEQCSWCAERGHTFDNCKRRIK
eukprot:PhF_6_TR14597/c0_g1_i1/m.23096